MRGRIKRPQAIEKRAGETKVVPAREAMTAPKNRKIPMAIIPMDSFF